MDFYQLSYQGSPASWNKECDLIWEKKVSADVIKDLEMKPTLIRVDPKSNDKCAKEENGKKIHK